jgi:hypothetical protein
MRSVLLSIAKAEEGAWEAKCQQVAALAAVRRALLDRGAAVGSELDARMARVARSLRSSPKEDDSGRALAELAREMMEFVESAASKPAPEALP